MQLYDLAVAGDLAGFNAALDALPAAISPAELSVLHKPNQSIISLFRSSQRSVGPLSSTKYSRLFSRSGFLLCIYRANQFSKSSVSGVGLTQPQFCWGKGPISMLSIRSSLGF